jgi:glycosyltransferase involved in cell wall biosynthesis
MSPDLRVAVVVPTLNSGSTLRACLASIADQTYPAVETIVVDNQSTDETGAIASEFGAQCLDVGPERSAQRNAGARASTGSILAFLDSDMVLEPDVVAEAVALLEHDDVVSIVIPEYSFGDGFFAQCRALEKRLYLEDSSVEAARIFRRTDFEAVGGYDESLTAAEDWDLHERISRRGGVARTDSAVWHNEGRITLSGIFTKKRYYGRWIAQYLVQTEGRGARHLTRSSLLSQPGELLKEPRHGAGLMILKVVEAVGVLTGAVDRWLSDQVGGRRAEANTVYQPGLSYSRAIARSQRTRKGNRTGRRSKT